MLVFSALEAAPRDLRALRGDIVERADRRAARPFAEPLGVHRRYDAAMRPVEAQAIADRAAKQLVDGNAERLGLQVHQRVLDRGDRLLVDPAGRRAGHAVEERGVPLDRARVLPDQARRQAGDDLPQPLRAVGLHELRPADQAGIGADLEEREVAPAGIAAQRLDLGDAHDGSPADVRHANAPVARRRGAWADYSDGPPQSLPTRRLHAASRTRGAGVPSQPLHRRAGVLSARRSRRAPAAADLEWRVSAGLGTVYATTVVHPREGAPYNVALIDMDEGFRMMSRVEDIAPMRGEDRHAGARSASIAGDGEEPPYPVFTPAEAT